MNALTKLWFLKLKSKIRHLFSRPLSAVFTVLMIVLYGFLCYQSISLSESMSTVLMLDFHMSIMIAIGFCALMIFMTLFQKRKALFFGEDAYYLFSGPFTKLQIMRYLLSQSILQSLLFGAVSIFIMICMSSVAMSVTLYVIIFIIISMIMLFFMMLTDYLYILSISNPKYKRASQFVAIALLVLVLIIFAVFLMQNEFNFEGSLFAFVESDLFYIVPFFGWGKLAIISFYENNYLIGLGMVMIMVVSSYIVYYLFTRFKGYFFEQALEDSFALSTLMKKAKAGENVTNETSKVREVTCSFKSGVWALCSKEILLLRKTKGYINKNDLIVLIVYFVISLPQGFTMYFYLLLFWLFNSLQSSNIVDELKHFQVYLIPEKPLKKMIALVLPTFFKATITFSVALGIGAFYFQLPFSMVLQNLISLLGYTMVFVSGTVLCIYVLKSRANAIMESMMRMLIMLVCSAPSFLFTFEIMNNPTSFTPLKLNVILYSALLLNFVISFAILYCCKNMLNGRELNDD